MGLFDNPYLDLDKTDIVGKPEFVQKGKEAQRKALVLLKNEENILPLAEDTKIFIKGMEGDLSMDFPQIVSSPDEADVIIQKLQTPSSPPQEAVC